MVDENANSNTNAIEKSDNISYVRKKNIISGIDNDALFASGLTLSLLIGLANLPQVQDIIKNILRPPQQQVPPNGTSRVEEPYIVPESEAKPQEEHQHRILQQPANQVKQEQRQYAEAVERDNQGGGEYNSFDALPTRETEPNKKDNKRQPYVPGSNVSAGL